MRIDTNRQWTTYRILDATIDNPDLADPLNIGATGAAEGKGFILWGDTSAAKIEWDEVNDRLLTTSATIRMGTTDKLEFRSASHYIQSDVANDLMINAGTNLMLGIGGTDVVTVAAAAITLAQPVTCSSTLAVIGEVTLSTHLNLGDYDAINFGAAAPDVSLRWHGTGGYMQMYPLTTGVEMQWGQVGLVMHHLILTTGELRFRDSALKIYSSADARLDIVSDNLLYLTATAVLVDNGYVRMASSNKLYFRDAIYINSGADGRLDIYSDGTAYNAIQITGNINLSTGYLKLFVTDADGDTDGQVWYDDSEDRIKFRGNSGTKVPLIQGDGQTITAYKVFTGDTKLYFRDDIFINSGADGRLDIYSDGTTHNAIQITTGGGASGIKLYAMLGLNVTGAIGDTDGQIWYNSNTNKFQGRANGATVDFH